jgi:hypothetical protein
MRKVYAVFAAAILPKNSTTKFSLRSLRVLCALADVSAQAAVKIAEFGVVFCENEVGVLDSKMGCNNSTQKLNYQIFFVFSANSLRTLRLKNDLCG